ncbi:MULTISPECIES: helix-turn-helix transcriptional regulator [Bacteroidota]|uniref:Transcriptional regulator n=1 Tax=Kaistella haifensis DSM 19056 TaxID=1450526 RepID=A0A246B9L9_9FLAO|nr:MULTISPECIES: helix-turn-helix transcriptional regulator [Bacteroidota]OWK98222.1 transcriptional regulator [Kaistella haifensis DSM 19056]PLK43942.1 XRE family transcriptional regulator [Emticicia sp. TH156]
MASFGQFIKVEREKHGWTQTEFGAKVGINAFAISKIENGTQKFNKAKLKELANLFDIDAQKVVDLFYADKFATEAYKSHCSDNVFIVAEDNVKYLKSINAKQGSIF